MISLTYVSRSLIAAHNRQSHLEDIQLAAISQNSTLDITGLLICAPKHFAQLLEGEQDSVEAIMSSILADNRHEEIRIIERERITSRRCPFWRMQIFDASNFANMDITPLLASFYTETNPEALTRLT